MSRHQPTIFFGVPTLYAAMLAALRDDRFDFDRAAQQDVLTFDSLPLLEEA